MIRSDWTGGCLCGAARYRLAIVPVAGDVIEQGVDHLGTVKSADFGHRKFCRDCGTPLLMEVDYQPETVDFSLATLDRPEAVTPGFHIFYAERIGWAEPADALPRHDRFRPDTRGPS